MLLEKARYAAFCRDVQRIIQMSQDIAVADKEYFYHFVVMPPYADLCGFMQDLRGFPDFWYFTLTPHNSVYLCISPTSFMLKIMLN